MTRRGTAGEPSGRHRRGARSSADGVAERTLLVRRLRDAKVPFLELESGVRVAGADIAWPDPRNVTRSLEVAVACARIAERCGTELAPGLKLRVRAGGVDVLRSDEVVARLGPSACAVWRVHGESPNVVSGRFECDGKHWDAAKRLVQRSRVGRANVARESCVEEPQCLGTEIPKASSAHLIKQPPANASPRQLGEMIVDSRRLRQERVRAFGLPIELVLRHDQLRVERLRLEPIRLNGRVPELPFRYLFDDRTFDGALRLSSPSEPMAIALYGDPNSWVSQLRPWHLALVGAAELSCERRGGLQEGTFTLVGDDGESVWTPPETWVPTQHTADWVARHVPGHFRRLPDGSASESARRNARAIGIELPESGLTWVRPHLNGLPPDTVLTFAWTPRLARG